MNDKFRYYKIVGIVGAFLLLFAFHSYSQEKWSLESCINYAIDNNIQIKQQALNVNYYQNQLNQSKYDRYPNLNGNMGYSFNFGKTITGNNTYSDENSSTIDFGINSEVTLFNSFAKQNTIKKREFELQATLQDLEKAKDDISLAVVQAYLEILFNKELVATSKEQLEITQQLIENNKKQVEAGNMAKGKIFETEAQYANEELTLTNYENQLSLSLLNLMQLLELEVTESFDIAIPNFDAIELGTELLASSIVYSKALSERPEILSKELQLQGIEKENAIAKAQLYPSLVAGGSYYTLYNNTYTYYDPITYQATDKIPFGDQLDGNRRGSLYLSLRIPIFNGMATKTNHQNSLINYENATYELQLEKNNLLKEIQQVHANAVAAMKKFYSSKKAVESTKEAFRYVEEKFNLGIVTPLEYNDSKNKVTNAQSSFIQAKYEYIFRIKILDFYNGNKITL